MPSGSGHAAHSPPLPMADEDVAAGAAVRAPTDTTALPVVIDVSERHAGEVRGHVEGVLGWQPVDDDTAVLVPPALRLVSPSSRPVGGGAPRLLLLPDGTDPVEAAEAGARHGVRAVVAWPSRRHLLDEVAAGLLARPREPRAGVEPVRVVGAGGGVGTSTVTLALAGLAAWRGARVLAVVDADAPVGEVRRVPADALAAHDLMSRASELPGVAGARVVVAERGTGTLPDTLPGVDVALIDGGSDADGDVLVCRPDRVALDRLSATAAGSVVVNGEGPVPRRVLARATGGRTCVELPTSARVARAVLLARVPASLPGAWLRRLLPVVPRPALDAPAREDLRT
jgi:hypothetical protein